LGIIVLLSKFKGIERTFQLGISGRNDVQVNRGCFYGSVTEELADGVKIIAIV
jgi:hypothetical protein